MGNTLWDAGPVLNCPWKETPPAVLPACRVIYSHCCVFSVRKLMFPLLGQKYGRVIINI